MVGEREMVGEKQIGKIVMIRTYSAGVHFGKLVERDGREVRLKNSRRVHFWEGACSLSQLATEGSKKRDECRISVPVKDLVLTEAIEILPMTEDAIKNLVEGKVWRID